MSEEELIKKRPKLKGKKKSINRDKYAPSTMSPKTKSTDNPKSTNKIINRQSVNFSQLPSSKFQHQQEMKKLFGKKKKKNRQSVAIGDMKKLRKEIDKADNKNHFFSRFISFFKGKKDKKRSFQLKKVFPKDDSEVYGQIVNKVIHFNNGTYKGTVIEEEDPNNKENLLVTLHGEGIYEYKSGSVYEGIFKKNFPNGNGTQKYSDGSKYCGNFLNGKFDGFGELYYPDEKIKYSGDFSKNKRHGIGIFYYKNGSIFCGNFHQNLRHGLGCIIFKDGREWMGYFDKNQKRDEYLKSILSKDFFPNNQHKVDLYYKKFKERGFGLTLIKSLSEEEFEILLEVIFEDPEDLTIAKKFFNTNREMFLNLFKGLTKSRKKKKQNVPDTKEMDLKDLGFSY